MTGRPRTDGTGNRFSRHEGGSALLIVMMIMSLTALLALSSLETVMRDRQAAGYQGRARSALYAAESGVAFATATVREDRPDPALGTPALHDWRPTYPIKDSTEMTLGSGLLTTSFYGDPAAVDASSNPQPIRYLGAGEPCWSGNASGAMNMNIGGGNVQWREALWDVRVIGSTTGGVEVPIQAVVSHCHPYN